MTNKFIKLRNIFCQDSHVIHIERIQVLSENDLEAEVDSSSSQIHLKKKTS